MLQLIMGCNSTPSDSNPELAQSNFTPQYRSDIREELSIRVASVQKTYSILATSLKDIRWSVSGSIVADTINAILEYHWPNGEQAIRYSKYMIAFPVCLSRIIKASLNSGISSTSVMDHLCRSIYSIEDLMLTMQERFTIKNRYGIKRTINLDRIRRRSRTWKSQKSI